VVEAELRGECTVAAGGGVVKRKAEVLDPLRIGVTSTGLVGSD
jgi:hypothetical protein